MSANPSINTEAFQYREAQAERREQATAAHFRALPAAPTQADRLYDAADRLYAAAMEVLEHYEFGADPVSYDEERGAVFEPTVVPHVAMMRLYAAARAAGGFR